MTIPTSRLGQVTAVITVQADQYALELIADSQEVVGLIKDLWINRGSRKCSNRYLSGFGRRGCCSQKISCLP